MTALLLALACASDPAPPAPGPSEAAVASPSSAPSGAGASGAPAAGGTSDGAAGGAAGGTPDGAAGGTPDGTPGAAPSVQTLLGQAPGIHFLGDWTSPGCDGRKYARNLHFEDHGEYAGIDLVSPCPPKAQCVWSGMVGYAGIWVQQDKKLELREIGGPTAPGSPHPTEIVSTLDGKLVENGCTYTRGLTVPDGYTEEQVRPKIPGSQ